MYHKYVAENVTEFNHLSTLYTLILLGRRETCSLTQKPQGRKAGYTGAHNTTAHTLIQTLQIILEVRSKLATDQDTVPLQYCYSHLLVC